MNYFELGPLFAVLLNLMTNQSYAQFTIACNTVESPILQKEPQCYRNANCSRYLTRIINISFFVPDFSDIYFFKIHARFFALAFALNKQNFAILNKISLKIFCCLYVQCLLKFLFVSSSYSINLTA